MAKVRDFLLNKIELLKRKGTNIQILQTNVMLKFNYLNTFLASHAPDVATEVRSQYVDTMGKYYHSKFKGYMGNLVKLQFEVAAKTDLVGEPESQMRSLFSSKTTLQNRTSVFSLGEREAVLEEVGKDSLISHIAAEKKQKFTYEFLFRSMLHLLCESGTTEYLFTHQFFGRMDSIFHQIFAKTIGLFMEQLSTFLANCYDAVGLLLMVRLMKEHQLIMSRRKVPILDQTFDKINMELWPRFKTVFDLNLDSVKNAKAAGGLTAADTHPHYVARKYAELAAAIYKLNVGIDNEMHVVNMSSFLAEMERLMDQLAKDNEQPKDQTIFLINNYDVILGILKERGIQNADVVRLEELLGQSTTKFVEEELGEHFDALIKFVREVEPLLQAGETNVKYSREQCSALVRKFATTWQAGIEAINGSVMKFFSNFQNGMEILKHVLTQLLLYYTRFTDLMKKLHGANAFQKDLVAIPTIMHEIKKYSRTFT